MKNRSKSKHPVVGIIMGSQSDLPKMTLAEDVFKQFKVPYEISIVSAHRTPRWMQEYALAAKDRNLKVIIAGAGGAAHLPGMVASLTPLPVIGVPILVGPLRGVDSLLSILQMPKGVPVATVAVDNATNAALLAIRILSLEDLSLASQLEKFMRTQEKQVLQKNRELKKRK